MHITRLRRREIVPLLAGAAAWPLAVRAQQPAVPVIGFLDGQSPDRHLMTAFRRALNEAGYVEGRNVAIEYRSADGRTNRLLTLAGDLVDRRVAVIVATGGRRRHSPPTRPPRPFRLSSQAAPIRSPPAWSSVSIGRAATQPGCTSSSKFSKESDWASCTELVPAAALIAVLLNPTNANFQTQLSGVQEAARAAGQQLNILSATSERDIDTAFAAVTESRAGALLVGSDPFFTSRLQQIVALAARHVIPAMYEGRDFAVAGGLASYGTSLADAYRQVGVYTVRILKGEKPADLPVVQPTKFEFVINLKTATALGLEVSAGLEEDSTRKLQIAQLRSGW